MTPNTATLERPAPATAPPDECDVLIIGGGPAGSTAAALLAERGVDVVIIEKEVHPRFHIGESLLPKNLQIIDRLGLQPAVAAMGIRKPGAEFVSDDTGASVTFPFSDSLNKKYVHSYQVPRAPFDEALFRKARDNGARTFEDMRATDVAFGGDAGPTRVTAKSGDGRMHHFTARYVLDASGRDTFLANRVGNKVSNKVNTTASVFAHFRGVPARTGELEGYLSVHLAEDGWFWMIPMPDGVMSVGFVGNQSAFKNRRGSPADLLAERIARSPTVSARMTRAERISEVYSAGNYSYRACSASGDGYMLIGDAFAFIDPVFSSGVLLAMQAGELGADVAATWLQDRRAGMAKARAAEKELCAAMDSLSWLIYRINNPVLRALFMTPKNTLRMRDGIVTLLTGNLGRSLNLIVPVLALKAVYYTMSFFYRVGFRLPPDPRALAAGAALAADTAD